MQYLIKAGQQRKCCRSLLFLNQVSGAYIIPSPMIIESPIFNDLFIWRFRITKKGKPAQVKSVNTLIAGLSSEMSHLV